MMLYFLLALVAAVCFALAAAGVKSRVNLVALGLLAWVLVPVLSYGSAAF